jgi:ATP adenylyltransferase/5',5'''-P-1,P-4-tetraphosphate phosphorylase II
MSLGTSRVVEERLDRALANNAWFNLFLDVVLENLVGPASDHYQILLNRSSVRRPHQAMHKFRYENAWQLELGFKDFVTHSWQM